MTVGADAAIAFWIGAALFFILVVAWRQTRALSADRVPSHRCEWVAIGAQKEYDEECTIILQVCPGCGEFDTDNIDGVWSATDLGIDAEAAERLRKEYIELLDEIGLPDGNAEA